jgi:hypothetical protein
MIRTLFVIAAGLPVLAAAAAIVRRAGFAPAWSVAARRGVGNLGIRAQMKVIA